MAHQPKAITIETKRPTLRITMPDGSEKEWQYDVIPLQLKIQELQDLAGKRQPGVHELAEFSDYLIAQGIPASNIDVAMRVWSLVIVQFAQLSRQISNEVANLCRSN